MTESRKQLASALGRLPSGLFIVTARHGEAESGMLASWVQQCAFEPPHLSVALKSDRPILGWLQEGSRFVVNILDHTQTNMVAHFGRGFDLDEPAFEGVEIERTGDGAVVLPEALAFLECRVTSRCPVADHLLIVAEVVGGRMLGEGEPMVHVRKSGFHY